MKAVGVQYPAWGTWIRKEIRGGGEGGEAFLEETGLESNIRG